MISSKSQVQSHKMGLPGEAAETSSPRALPLPQSLLSKAMRKQQQQQQQQPWPNLYLLPLLLLHLLMSSTLGPKLATCKKLPDNSHELQQNELYLKRAQQNHHHHDHHHDHHHHSRASAAEEKSGQVPLQTWTIDDILMINDGAITTETTSKSSSWMKPTHILPNNVNQEPVIIRQIHIRDRFDITANNGRRARSSSNNSSNHERRKREAQPGDQSGINKNIGPESETLEMSSQLTSSSSAVGPTISNDSTPNATITTFVENNNNINDDASSDPLKCRVEKNLYLDFEQYKHYTCANCYKLIPAELFERKLLYRKESRIWLFDELANRTLLPNETETVKVTFKNEYNYQKWRDCCRDAEQCCLNNRKYLPKTRHPATGELIDEEPRDRCHATWDGLACWSESPPGLVEQQCRPHVYFFDFEPVCLGSVKKQCFSNGSWFNREDHEWSNFSGCAADVLTIYATRLLIGSAWHLVSAIIIGPALIVFNKMPNRGGSKRVRILRNLLFWLLVNSLLSASHKIGVIGGFFNQTEHERRGEPSPLPPPSPPPSSTSSDFTTSLELATTNGGGHLTHLSAPHYSGQLTTNTAAMSKGDHDDDDDDGDDRDDLVRNTRSLGHLAAPLDSWQERWHRAKLHYEQLDAQSNSPFLAQLAHRADDHSNPPDQRHQLSAIKSKAKRISSMDGREGHLRASTTSPEQHLLNGLRSPNGEDTTPAAAAANHLTSSSSSTLSSDKLPARELTLRGSMLANKQTNVQSQRAPPMLTTDLIPVPELTGAVPVHSYTTTTKHKLFSAVGRQRYRRSTSGQSRNNKPSPPMVFVCWMVTVGIRVTRLLHYAWMFTGAVYLCSILHFAPAEPPSLFIKFLMILTNGFPGVIGIIYIITRTIYEPSPLTLLVKLPYYKLIGDTDNARYLWDSQLVCWMSESKHEFIEDIAEFPNLVLIILNAGLFIVTLIIMCRITRPGSTRPEMSLGDYFKAAGTLVLLYGAHYALIAYRPPIEGCIKAQVFYYLFLFVDGIQGIAVSYVFCYRTNEGREITNKWRAAWRRYALKRLGLKGAKRNSTRQQSLLGANNKSNQSTRSNNSVCNGKDMATELINITDIQAATSQC